MTRLWSLALAAVICAVVAGTAVGGYVGTVGGISVKYSKGGATAYYDSVDDTLTVEAWEDGGTLSITVGKDASYYWGSYVDIYILANDTIINSIKIKGSWDCLPYICGQCYYFGSFSLNTGVVGDTDSYGDMGLGTASAYFPMKIAIANGWSVGPIAGVSYASALAAGAGERSVGKAGEKAAISPKAKQSLPGTAKSPTK